MKSKKQKKGLRVRRCPIFTTEIQRGAKNKNVYTSADFLFLPLKIGEEQKTRKKKVCEAADVLFLLLNFDEGQKQKSTQPQNDVLFFTDFQREAKKGKRSSA